MKTFCQPRLPPPPLHPPPHPTGAIGSVIKSSSEHKWEISKTKKWKKKRKKTQQTLALAAQSAPLSPPGERRGKVNYIKQTYVILIPLKLWITALINHSLIWSAEFICAPSQRNKLIPLQQRARDYSFLLPELFFIAPGLQLNYLCVRRLSPGLI